MPYLFVKNYEVDLMHMNKSLHHIYIESVKKSGGERRVCQMRIHENGLPLTLIENYRKDGQLLAETDAQMLASMNIKVYFKLLVATVTGSGQGDRIKPHRK